MSFFNRYTKIEFRLIDTDGVVLDAPGDFIEVEEPKDYEATKFILERITNSENIPRHGFNFSYGDPESPIIFIKAAGYQLVQDVYEIKGNDAQMQYKFLATDVRDNSVKADIKWYLDFNTYNREWVNGEPRVTLTVINESLAYKIKSRYESTVNLLANKDMDGGSITPLVMDENYWHGKVIKKLANIESGDTESGLFYWPSEITDQREREIFFFNYPINIEENDIESIFNYNGNPYYAPDDIDLDGFFLLDAPDEGSYNIKYRFKHTLQVEWTRLPDLTSIDDQGIMELYYKIGENGTPVKLETFNTPQYIEAQKTSVFDLNANPVEGEVDINLKKGDNLYFYWRYVSEETDTFGDFRYKRLRLLRVNPGAYIRVVALTQPVSTLVRSLDIYDFIQRTFEIISGKSNIVKSDFYDTECGSQRWLTNGYQIRNFESDERPPETTPETLIDAISMIDAVGWGYEKIGGEVKVRMEQSDYFYQDSEILKIDVVHSYKEENADELIINQLVFQFKDYIEEELNTLDAFATKGEFLTPITTKLLQLELFCEFIADAYSIEYTRREQFNESPSESWRYDNNIFIVDWVEILGLSATSKKDTLAYNNNTFELKTASFSGDGVVTIPLIIPELVDLTSFTSNSTLNTGTFTVTSVEFDEVNNRTIINVSETTAATSGLFEFTFGGGFTFKRPESDQNFSTVNNLISPATTYNLRMSMKRLIMKHAKWINSGLNYKEATDVIKTNFLDHNKSLETQLRASATCIGGDLNKILLEEKADLTLSDYANFARYFVPLKVIYQGELSFDENETIRNALNGGNYGYLSIRNKEGGYTKVFPNQHIYRPYSGIIEGNGYKKFE